MYEPGSVVAGKYRIEHVLGRGGMGIVVAAEHVDLRTKIALKFLAEHYTEHAIVVERFLREARASARLRSEHVCRVFDVDRLENGTPFIVMELLEGRDLSRALKADGPFDAATAADFVIQACDALSEAHASGIVHRDLKPANLFLVRRRDAKPLIKVLDFGVAKAQDEQDPSITKTENVVGSPSYMAPEQLRSARFADARSDVWSLGVILIELTTGKKPFVGDSTIDLALQIVNDSPTFPPTLPAAIGPIVERCLRKDPEERPQRAADLAAALESVARGVAAPRFPTPVPMLPPTTIEVVPAPADTEPLGGTTLGSASGVMHRRAVNPKRRAWVIAAAAVVAVGIGVGAAQIAMMRGTSTNTSTSTNPQPATVTVAGSATATVTVTVTDAATATATDAATATATEPDLGSGSAIAVPAPTKRHHTTHRAKTKEELGESRQ